MPRGVRDATLGASHLGKGRTRFLIWAPRARQVRLQLARPLPGAGASPGAIEDQAEEPEARRAKVEREARDREPVAPGEDAEGPHARTEASSQPDSRDPRRRDIEGAGGRAAAALEPMGKAEAPAAEIREMQPSGGGYHVLEVEDAPPGTLYSFSLDGGPWRPDPVSRRLPLGVHGPSEVVDLTFEWTDQGWRGARLEDVVLYELHVGTFTEEGTLDAVIRHLDELSLLGVTAVELMPLAEVPGSPNSRNWGYDGVQPFAVRQDYGGIPGLHRLVDACHARGLAVVLDVVYNHLGPEGNYLHELGPYFTDQYHTPWGAAPNLDGPGSDEVRRYFVEHALECFERHHIDGLRLDAVVSLFDRSARPFLEELSEATDALSERLGRPLLLFGEADDNDPRWIRLREQGGLGLHAMWADDLHHAIHAYMTGERFGYYVDFGEIGQVASAFFRGSALEGAYARYRGRRWGRPLEGVPPERLVVYAQNHDQVGNRPDGARLSIMLEPARHRAALALALLSPHLPLLFMGQEHGEARPFHFFTSFGDPALSAAVRAGRDREHRSFGWSIRAPDPSDPETRRASVLDRDRAASPEGLALRALHRRAIGLRRALRGAARPRLLGQCESPGSFWGLWPQGHLLLAVLDEGGIEIEAPVTGRLLFDSEGFGETSRPVSEEIWVGGRLDVEGPRVVVYGPPESTAPTGGAERKIDERSSG